MSINFAVIGISHKTASLEVRERLGFTVKNELMALEKLKESYPENEHVIVSTCNRVEVYIGRMEGNIIDREYITFLAEWHGVSVDEILPFVYTYTGNDAVRHLFEVASGIDSLIIGEFQILGQVKESYERALLSKSTHKALNVIFQKSFKAAKKVRALTKIGEGNISISSVSCDLAQEILGSLKKKKVLLIGAGDMGGLALESLHRRGADTVLVSSKNYQKASILAERFGGEAVLFEEKEHFITKADIVISATSAPRYILHPDMIKRVMASRSYRPIFMIDLAVPRDIDPVVSSIPGVHLYNVDSLKRLADERLRERENSVSLARGIIFSEVENATHRLNKNISIPVE